MENQKKERSNTGTWIIGGLAAVGLSIGGLTLASNNAETAQVTNVEAQTESVINLPATNEKVNGLDARHNSDLRAVNEQINRREVEMRNERDKLLENLKETQRLDRERIIRLENLVVNLIRKQ